MFLDAFHDNGSVLPHLPFLDTLVLSNGELDYMIYHDKHKMILEETVSSIKKFVIDKKMKTDL